MTSSPFQFITNSETKLAAKSIISILCNPNILQSIIAISYAFFEEFILHSIHRYLSTLQDYLFMLFPCVVTPCGLFRVLRMQTVRFSEILGSTYESTRRHNPEERHQHLHRRENLKSHTYFLVYLITLSVQAI
jgi:hypothetical protein